MSGEAFDQNPFSIIKEHSFPPLMDLMDPSSIIIFTREAGKNEIKSYQYNLKREAPPDIPREEKRFAEAIFFDSYDEKGNKQRLLRIDLLGSDGIVKNVSEVITFYDQKFSNHPDWKTERKKLIVMVNLPDGSARVPFERLLNPSFNLLSFLNNLPKILERRKVRYFLRNAFEIAGGDDNFLKYLYKRGDDEAKKIVLEIIGKRYHLSKESFKNSSYFDIILERLYSRFISLRDRFLFDPSLLDLPEEGLEEKIKRLPAVPHEIFIPLIDKGQNPEEKEVPLSSIITAQAKETGTIGDNWLDYLIRRSESYMRKFLRACLRGDLNLKNPHFDGGYNLLCLGNDFYMVLNGRHRTVAAKLLGMENIKANVYNLPPQKGEKREIFKRNLREIQRRINLGLIKGEVSFDREGRIFLTVEEYEGPWVFYQDMEKAKEFFTSSNSSVLKGEIKGNNFTF